MPFKRFLVLLTMFWVGESAAQTTITPNPLAGLPGSPGSSIDQINALGKNKWLNLGAPAADPVWGRARGCSWGGKSMVLAPDLRGAFRTGEGWHAYVKPDGFGQDDYWFYDINGHRWICLYPGTDTKNFNQRVKDGDLYVDGNGQPLDRGGQPIPGHLLIHAFGYISYDTDLKKFAIHRGGGFGRYYMPGLSVIEEGLSLLEGQGLNKSGPAFAPWAYNTLTGKFERDLAVNASPDVGGYFPQYLYIPSKKLFFSAGVFGIAFFNPATRAWGPLLPNTANPASWSLACYDSKRDRVYGGASAGDLYCFDVKSQVLTKIANASSCSPTLDNNRSALVYDSINDAVLLLAFVTSGDPCFGSGKIHPFDPGTQTWGSPIPIDPAFSSTRRETNAAFFDPALGVVFIYTAGDSYDNGVMWAYRYGDNPSAAENGKTSQRAAHPIFSLFPNPVGQDVTIDYSVPQKGRVEIGIYGLDGALVRQIAGPSMTPGNYRAVWDGRDGGGRKAAAGFYLCRVKTNGAIDQKRFILAK